MKTMTDMKSLEQEVSEAIATSSSKSELEELKVQILGSNGKLQNLLKNHGNFSSVEQKKLRESVYNLRNRIRKKIATRLKLLERKKSEEFRKITTSSVSEHLENAIFIFNDSQKCENDFERFLMLWRVYEILTHEVNEKSQDVTKSKSSMTMNFDGLVKLDKSDRFNTALQEKNLNSIWPYILDLNTEFHAIFSNQSTVQIGYNLFKSLHRLRNELVHYIQINNKEIQTKAGIFILSYFIPVFIEILIENLPNKVNDHIFQSSELDSLEHKFKTKIAAASTESELEEVRVQILGKNGILSKKLKNLGKLDPEERREVGYSLNSLKSRVIEVISIRREILEGKTLLSQLTENILDMTLPARLGPANEGRIHPVSQVTDELTAIFADMGFAIAEGPDIETDYYNFTALNFPESHPAREEHDTFFFHEKEDGSRKLLRTHTSPVQIHTMESQKPPIRVIIPGRTYRCDSDQTHTPMFHQVEGLVIDKSTHIGHLKWTLEEFCKVFFEVDDVPLRFRPSFFPFTEPSLELDIGCSRDGSEVKIGEGNDWLEILGSGMVHPNVLRMSGIDPDIYQGFAFGIGIDRLAMLKYGIPDLRTFFDADIRWLKHYGFRALDVPNLPSGLSN